MKSTILKLAILLALVLGFYFTCNHLNNRPLTNSQTIMLIKETYGTNEWVQVRSKGMIMDEFIYSEDIQYLPGIIDKLLTEIHVSIAINYTAGFGYNLDHLLTDEQVSVDILLNDPEMLFFEIEAPKYLNIESGYAVTDGELIQKLQQRQEELISGKKAELMSDQVFIASIKEKASEEFTATKNKDIKP